MPHVALLSIPNLRQQDLALMPRLRELMEHGEQAELVASFPCVTCCAQANMTTGRTPDQHGVVANGFYWRDKGEVEMWTAWNEAILAPQIWDRLHQHDSKLTSAVWFPMLSKGAQADFVCTPAPIHNPDGSESLWCYTRPVELYGELRDALGHFPLMHFWGPLANIKSTDWIVDSAIHCAKSQRPNFFYLYLPHLDYAAQKFGPDSPQAEQAVLELDATLGRLVEGFTAAYQAGAPAAASDLTWLVASEYSIVPVDHVVYPNRILREAGWLEVLEPADGDYLEPAKSRAWAMVDHQLSHIFVQDRNETAIAQVASLFQGLPGIAEVLTGDQRGRYNLVHERSGDVILISTTNSWQAYYWWLHDERAPTFARTVDIHQKPGYDPIELHFDLATRSIPINARLARGSHGAPENDALQRGVLLSSRPRTLGRAALADTDVFDVVLRQFGL
ncbi:MAG TPA: nucleotide pyrophosphatase/phosphodiesterase family protein [Pirellulales bacterium]|jgi:hypothetical protein|nr:nucleotide pyrophosphatase/phosphodiesterase family protein [Pirellulales bacterium]